ncbi:hypothetical protein E5Z02_27420, partial [Streptomyces rhizosphaericola]
MRRELIRGVGRHSRKGAEATRPDAAAAEQGARSAVPRPASGTGRRRRQGPMGPAEGPAPFEDAPQVRGGHPESHEAGGGWGAGPAYAGQQHATPPAQPYGPPGRPPQDQGQDQGRGPGQGAVPGQDRGPGQDQEAREQAVARQVSAQRAAAQRAADERTARQPAAGP